METENGPQFGDEINLVKGSFNSGWMKVQGIWSVTREPKIRDLAFGAGFDWISDMEVWPDGYLYVVSYEQGAIYKIAPK